MNEELAKKADKLFDMLISGVQAGVEQMPQLVDEYLTYFLINEISDLLLCLLWLIPAVGLFVISYYMKRQNENNWEMPMIYGIIVCGVFFVAVGACSIDIVKLKYTPKAYLIEKIRN